MKNFSCFKTVKNGKVFLSVILFCNIIIGIAQNNPSVKQWQWEYPSDLNSTYPDTEDWPLCIIQTSDGGYASAGWAVPTYTLGVSKHPYAIVKLNAAGNKLWEY